MKRGVVYVEGVAPINACVNEHLAVEWVVYPAGVRLSGWAQDTIHRLSPEVAYELAPALMNELSERSDSSELIVVARRPTFTLEDLPADGASPTGQVVLVLDRPSNHGNLGSIIRSADAFSVDGIVVTGHGVDMYAPPVIRASLGACFSQRLVFEPSSQALVDWIEGLRQRATAAGTHLRVLATDSEGATPLGDSSLAPPIVLLLGNEATGVSTTLRELADTVVAIPIAGSVNSLNLACAASIFLYTISRDRLSE